MTRSQEISTQQSGIATQNDVTRVCKCGGHGSLIVYSYSYAVRCDGCGRETFRGRSWEAVNRWNAGEAS